MILYPAIQVVNQNIITLAKMGASTMSYAATAWVSCLTEPAVIASHVKCCAVEQKYKITLLGRSSKPLGIESTNPASGIVAGTVDYRSKRGQKRQSHLKACRDS